MKQQETKERGREGEKMVNDKGRERGETKRQ